MDLKSSHAFTRREFEKKKSCDVMSTQWCALTTHMHIHIGCEVCDMKVCGRARFLKVGCQTSKYDRRVGELFFLSPSFPLPFPPVPFLPPLSYPFPISLPLPFEVGFLRCSQSAVSSPSVVSQCTVESTKQFLHSTLTISIQFWMI